MNLDAPRPRLRGVAEQVHEHLGEAVLVARHRRQPVGQVHHHRARLARADEHHRDQHPGVELEKVVRRVGDHGDARADVRARDARGHTALLAATHADDVEAARLLIAAGADRQFCCSACRTAYAIINEHGLDDYYAVRGWTPDGIPTPEKLAECESFNLQALNRIGEIIGEYELPAHSVVFGVKGCTTWSSNPVRNYRDYKATDFDLAELSFLWSLNHDIMTPPGLDEQWLISFAHGQAEIDFQVEDFRNFAKYVRS